MTDNSLRATPPRRINSTRRKEFDQVVKFLILGDSAVGKSSLLLRFCDNKFETSHVLTIGVDFKSRVVEVEGERVKVQVWDTAGQERFRNITPAYFRSAMGIILVFDVTRADSLQNLRFWLKNLEDHTDKTVQRIIVGNKTDISPRQVSSKKGLQLATEYDLPYFESSAKLNENVDTVFLSLAEMVLKAHKDKAILSGPMRGSLQDINKGILLDEPISEEEKKTWDASKCCSAVST